MHASTTSTTIIDAHISIRNIANAITFASNASKMIAIAILIIIITIPLTEKKKKKNKEVNPSPEGLGMVKGCYPLQPTDQGACTPLAN